MSGFRTPELAREQIVLWEHRLDDALSEAHPVRLFDQVLRSAAFARTFRDWETAYDLSEGKPPYHPRDLAGLYLYGLMNRLRSSRQLEAACYNRLDVIWLLSAQHPDHATIAAFVARHEKRLRQLHRDVLQIAIEAGLLTLGHVAYDGTKIAANAGKGSVASADKISGDVRALDERIAALEREWKENETRERSLLGEELVCAPASDRELARLKERQARLQKALHNIERRRAASTHATAPKPIASRTDPDSRVMPSKEGGSRPNYNAQIGVDAGSGMIVAANVCDEADDSAQLVPLLDQTRENLGALPPEASADSGYTTGPNLAALEERQVTGFLPSSATKLPAPNSNTAPLADAQWAALPKNTAGQIGKDAFTYDERADAYRCPMGQVLSYRGRTIETKNYGERERRTYTCGACQHCPRAQQCCGNTKGGRTIKRDQYEPQRERLRARMATPQAQARYGLRKAVERRFGLIKHLLGVRRFLRRGLEAVRTEWRVVCTAVNLGILLRHWAQVKLVL